MDNDIDSNVNVKPYKATRNLNTIIDNPSVNVDNNLNVNIKDLESPSDIDKKSPVIEENSIFQNQEIQCGKNTMNKIEQQYINKVFNFDSNSNLYNIDKDHTESFLNNTHAIDKENSNDNIDDSFNLQDKLFNKSIVKTDVKNIADNSSTNNIKYNDFDSNKSNLIDKKNIPNLKYNESNNNSNNDDSLYNINNYKEKKYIAVNNTSNTNKKNSKFEFGSEFKIVITIAIILLIFLIFLPMINKIIIGY